MITAAKNPMRPSTSVLEPYYILVEKRFTGRKLVRDPIEFFNTRKELINYLESEGILELNNYEIWTRDKIVEALVDLEINPKVIQ